MPNFFERLSINSCPLTMKHGSSSSPLSGTSLASSAYVPAWSSDVKATNAGKPSISKTSADVSLWPGSETLTRRNSEASMAAASSLWDSFSFVQAASSASFIGLLKSVGVWFGKARILAVWSAFVNGLALGFNRVVPTQRNKVKKFWKIVNLFGNKSSLFCRFDLKLHAEVMRPGAVANILFSILSGLIHRRGLRKVLFCFNTDVRFYIISIAMMQLGNTGDRNAGENPWKPSLARLVRYLLLTQSNRSFHRWRIFWQAKTRQPRLSMQSY